MSRTITRMMNRYEEEFEKELTCIHSRSNFNMLLNRIEVENNKAERNQLVSRLKKMLKDSGIVFDGDLFAYGRSVISDIACIKNLLDKIPLETGDDVTLWLLNKVQELVLDAPSPKDYMNRLVDHICKDEWSDCSLRLRMLKRFIKYGRGPLFDDPNNKNKPGAGYGGRAAREYLYQCACSNVSSGLTGKTDDYNFIAENIDEDVFDVLSDEKVDRNEMKPDGKYGLIKCVNDLSKGLFRSNQSTKKDLYILAMVLDMSFFCEDDVNGMQLDVKTDVEENLFKNYYQNNIKRFLDDSYWNGDGQLATAYEIIPSNVGINYKNYAELTYIYYISKTDLSPEEKIRRSALMIRRIKNSGVIPDRVLDTVESEKLLKNTIIHENMSEEDFYKQITENLLTKIDGINNYGPMQLAVSSAGAFDSYSELIEMIEDEGYGSGDLHQGMYLDVVSEKMTSQMKRILDVVDMLLKKDYANTKDQITRTHFISAYYDYFVNFFDNDDSGLLDFKDVYSRFKYGIDHFLISAGYPEINPKNLLDILVIISAYSHLVL